MSDFWDALIAGHTNGKEASSLDEHLSGRALGASFESVRALTDRERQANGLQLPVKAGTRVTFVGSLGAVLSTDDPPEEGMLGTVVTAKSAGREITSHDGKVFVKWADGRFRSIHSEFLRLASDQSRPKEARTARQDPTDPAGRIPVSQTRIRVASLGDLTNFLKVADHTLVHKSTRDLWTFQKDADGSVLVQRLFNDNGSPLKG